MSVTKLRPAKERRVTGFTSWLAYEARSFDPDICGLFNGTGHGQELIIGDSNTSREVDFVSHGENARLADVGICESR